LERPLCEMPGCEYLAEPRGDGYRRWCTSHRKNKHWSPIGRGHGLGRRLHRSQHEPCDNCGWNEAPCDRHRMIPSYGYVDGNVVILCPNCHRIVTFYGEHWIERWGLGEPTEGE